MLLWAGMSTSRLLLGPADLRPGEVRAFFSGGHYVLVTLVDGRYVAMDDQCNHAGCLLSGGRVEDGVIVCPGHEVGFDLKTGKNVTSPSVCGDQSVFTIAIEDGRVYLIT